MNAIQRFAVRLAARVAPPLGRVLQSAGGTLERLEASNYMFREMLAQKRDFASLEIADMKDAIAMHGGGWLARESSGKLDAKIHESDSTAVVKCKETIADLQLALEDRGWWRDLNQSQWEFSRWGIQRIILLCRLYRIKNPLIQRGILVSAYYVFGRGFEVSSEDETANEVLEGFFSDPRNKDEIGQRALTEKHAAKYTDGNIFWCFFTDPGDGQVIIRSIDALEIEEIISDPNDASCRRYYHRRWVEQQFDEGSGVTKPVIRDEWYVALGYDAPKGTKIQGKPLYTDSRTGERIPVYHTKSGGLLKWKFGCPKAYAALDWARAYKRRLENYATISEALARFSWSVETEGGAPAIAAFKQTLATTLGNVDGLSVESNPPPVTGSAFISSPSNKLTPIKTAGVAPDPEEGRRLALMVYCVFGLPETFFADVSVGTLATAQSLDRPTELGFLKEQEAWREDLQRISEYVLERSKTAPKGKLREGWIARGLDPGNMTILMVPAKHQGSDGIRIFEKAPVKPPKERVTIDVKFPAIIQGDELSRVSAIVEAMTLNGFEATGIDLKTGIGLLLTELGVENVQDVLEEMFPDACYDADRTELLDAAKELALNPPDPTAMGPAGAPPEGPKPKTAKPRRISPTAKEARQARAVNALLKAAQSIKENGR